MLQVSIRLEAAEEEYIQFIVNKTGLSRYRVAQSLLTVGFIALKIVPNAQTDFLNELREECNARNKSSQIPSKEKARRKSIMAKKEQMENEDVERGGDELEEDLFVSCKRPTDIRLSFPKVNKETAKKEPKEQDTKPKNGTKG